MRIIAGKYGSRSFEPPKGNRTHPMSEKIRGAIFNSLGDIDKQDCLDAYAGSGALGFEFLSRGGKTAVLVEKDKNAVQAINKTKIMLNIGDECKVTQANVSSWSDNNIDTRFDIVFADPPYEKVNTEVLEKLSTHVRKGGTLVLSLPPKLNKLELPNMTLSIEKNYGDATVTFYVKP